MKQIIAIVGMPGAGKSEASVFFKQKNFPVVRFGDITDEEIEKIGLPMTQENEKKTRERLREEFGMAAYAIKSESKIREAMGEARVVVLDGLRSWEEYEYLSGKFSNLQLLAVYASPEIRHRRLSERKERSLTLLEARNRDVAELINLHMGPPIALADYLIKNEGSVDNFYKELEKFLEVLEAFVGDEPH